MTRREAESLMTVAGISFDGVWELMNGYWPRPDPEDDERSLPYYRLIIQNPWWLFKTQWGLIRIGWRKRVISIDWTDWKVRAEITKDDVTKGDASVHAWGMAKAAEYLTALRILATKES